MRSHGAVWDRMRADEILAPPPGLCFSSDCDPGWHRQRRGRGFSYVDADGEPPTAAQKKAIEALVIPPAWTDVWICAEANGHIQATGRDERGRKQYRYHADWTAHRSGNKFDRLLAFAKVLPALRAQVDADLRRRSLGRDRVAASVVWLLDNSLIRVGNPAYARDNKSFGLTTLRRKHVAISGQAINFRFKGKSGKDWNLQLVDRRMSRLVKSMHDLPGQHLFKYQDEDGFHAISSRDINDYIAEHAGEGFSSKHFRTWAATVRAFGLLCGTEVPETKTARNKLMTGVVDQVASKLGNTRAVCRSSYIHPAVFEEWQAGTLVPKSRLKPIEWFDEEELGALAFLKRLSKDK